MTAEIALLNKMAVALAADSAVTIDAGNAAKVYNSADKIFEGTMHDPIGIMVYNRPELNGVPVEVIVKMYRDRDCNANFSTVFDFASAFLKHIESLDTPEVTVNETVTALAEPRILAIHSAYEAISDETIRGWTSGNLAFENVDAVFEAIEQRRTEFLQLQLATLSLMQDQSWADGLTVADVLSAHGERLGEIVSHVFGSDLPHPTHQTLLDISALALLKEYQPTNLTGLVFAGFGKDEIFPSLVSYEIFGTVAGRLKHIQTRKFDVDRKLVPDAAVIPFAQQEMVDRFVYGLDNQFFELCTTFFSGSLGKLKAELNDLLPNAGDEVLAGVEASIDSILNEFRGEVVDGHMVRLRGELSEMVRMMPKQELAALSESLVHITSLKRKFSAEAESVGGPIDVAMITRAEGFVWVKRKHYFDPAFNPRFLHRRYGGNTPKAESPLAPAGEAS